MSNSRSITKTETLSFVEVMDKISQNMWIEKDAAIERYKAKGGKKPYRFDDNFYTTASDMKYRWERDWHLAHEVKLIDAPKGSKMQKCRSWLCDQERKGMMDSMSPKKGIISNARFKRRNKLWGHATIELMMVKPEMVHINDGAGKAYCQSRKKKTERKKSLWARSRPKKFIGTTKNKSEVTCKQCKMLLESSNSDIQKDIIVLTIQNDT